MRIAFHTNKLRRLYEEEKGVNKYPPEVIDSFFDVMAVIVAAADERDLRAMKGYHYHKLKGDRKEEHAINLNKQFRLTLKRQKDKGGRYLLLLDIEDYH